MTIALAKCRQPLEISIIPHFSYFTVDCYISFLITQREIWIKYSAVLGLIDQKGKDREKGKIGVFVCEGGECW